MDRTLSLLEGMAHLPSTPSTARGRISRQAQAPSLAVVVAPQGILFRMAVNVGGSAPLWKGSTRLLEDALVCEP